MKKLFVPPIKSQGIKTKLLPWITHHIYPSKEARFVEPFMGTGVVGFNVGFKHALFCDKNPHIIDFYQALQKKRITSVIVKNFLIEEGEKLRKRGEEHYYEIRDRFNTHYAPLDFLFLNRSCFNGMIRFNRKNKFNVPFCRKPERFAQAYVTKIVNQVKHVEDLIHSNDWTFKCQNFKQTLEEVGSEDLIYCDPPYIGRHVDYYDSWGENDEKDLHDSLMRTQCRFILSTWHSNEYRQNIYLQTIWAKCFLKTRNHFYHVGGKETNRKPMLEALVSNQESTLYIEPSKKAINENLELVFK